MARLELGTRTKVVKTLQAVPPVLADETRLAQVFVNLLVNAGQAFAEGGAEVNHIFISTGLDADGQIVVEIRDDGPGMDSKTAARLFEPFFTTKPVGRGTGLGLAISHTAIKEFGGTLTCVTAPGKGSTFRIVLKPASAGPAGDVEVAVSSPRADRIRILVIDDEPAVTASIERVLREEHSVSVINDPREALLVLASGHSFDLVLCDLMMPELSGVDLFHRVLSSRPELAGRFAFMTGGIMFAEARRFLDKVTNERLEKPLSMEGLRGLARRYATKARIS
jgi:CheY-like chemotaxis protein